MQAGYTFEEIADLFYEVGVISKPERPYGTYEGTKRDYAREKLVEAPDLDLFLQVTVPKVVAECDVEGIGVASVEQIMQQLGYTLSDDGRKHGIADYLPPGNLPSTNATGGEHPEKRIDLPDLPAAVQTLIDELEDNLTRGNLNAAALLTRKIIQEAVFIAMQKTGKAGALKDKDGAEVDLAVALARCQQAFGLSNQVMSRITSAKWIGDSANHSFRVKISDADLDRTVTGVRLFLQEIL